MDVSPQLHHAYEVLAAAGLGVPVLLPGDSLPEGNFLRLSLVSATHRAAYGLTGTELLGQASAFGATYLDSLTLADAAGQALDTAGLQPRQTREGPAEVGSHHLVEFEI